jgi:hypothetical protein
MADVGGAAHPASGSPQAPPPAGRRAATVLHGGAIVASALLALLALAWAVAALLHPTPLEFRENASVLLTQVLLRGDNPWAIDQQPLHMYVYGWAYPVVTTAVAWLAGGGPQVHRAVSLAFLLLFAVAMYRTLRKEGTGRGMSAYATLFALFLLAQGLSVTARGDSLGLLLFWLSLTVPLRGDLRWPGLLAGAGLAILAFFTKPYFILALPLLSAWLFLFVNVRKGLVLGGIGVLGLVASILLVDRLLPVYFSNTFFHHLNNAMTDWSHLFRESRIFATEHGLLVAAGLAAWLLARRNRPGTALPRGEGMLPWSVRLPVFATVVDSLIMVAKLGLHPGNGQLYYHQLLTPFVVWWAAPVIDRLRPRSMLTSLALLGAVVLLLCHLRPWPPPQTKAWTRLAKAIEASRQPFVTPPLAWIAYQAGKPIWDNGQTAYCPQGVTGNPSRIVPMYQARCLAHFNAIHRRLHTGEFDLVITTRGPNMAPLVIGRALARYQRVGMLPMAMPFGSYDAEIWVRAPSLGRAPSPPGP